MASMQERFSDDFKQSLLVMKELNKRFRGLAKLLAGGETFCMKLTGFNDRVVSGFYGPTLITNRKATPYYCFKLSIELLGSYVTAYVYVFSEPHHHNYYISYDGKDKQCFGLITVDPVSGRLDYSVYTNYSDLTTAYQKFVKGC